MLTEEEKRLYEKSFDLIDYLGNGNTLYDYIDRYMDIGDYSTVNLMNVCRKLYDKSGSDAKVDNMHYFYSQFFDKLTNELSASLNNDESANNRTLKDTEKETILAELQNVSDVHFDSIGEYIKYVKDNNFSNKYYTGNRMNGRIDRSLDSLNNVLIKRSLDVASEDTKNFVRYSCVKSILIPAVKHQVFLKYDSKTANNEEEWLQMHCFEQAIKRPSDLRNYDDLIIDRERQIKEFIEKHDMDVRCSEKRKKAVLQDLKGALSPENKKLLGTMNLDEILYNTSLNYSKQNVGSYRWGIEEFDSPKIICDGFAKYSNSVEGQRVFAASYGRFGYETLFRDNNGKNPTYSSNGLELVGISRLGKDGLKNYFVLMPFDNITLKKVQDLNDTDLVLDLFTNGQKRPILDRRKLDEYTFVQCDRIPKELEDFYLSTGFSDYHLSNSINNNFRFAGSISLKNGRPEINSNYASSAYDLDACRYASNHSGTVGNRTYYSLEDYCQSTELMAKHMKIVKQISQGIKKPEKSKNQEER